MRIHRRTVTRSGGLLLALGLAATLTGCGTDQEPKQQPTDPLNGVYTVTVQGDKLTNMGRPSPGKSWSRQYAVRTSCADDGCTQLALRLRDDDPTAVFTEPDGTPAEPMVADFVDGSWQLVEQTDWTCSDGSVGLQTVQWSLIPGEDALTGTRIDVRTASPECVVVLEEPVTMTRTGDIDAGIDLPETVDAAPWQPSAPAGLTGSYERVATDSEGAEVDRATVDFRSFCVRNSDDCVALKRFQDVDGPVVVPFLFESGQWSAQFNAGEAECPGSGSPGHQLMYEQYALPEDATTPIQSLTGSELVTVHGGCAGVMRDFDLALQRQEG